MSFAKGKVNRFWCAALMVSALGFAGCGASADDDDEAIDSLDLNTEKDDGIVRPVGTFYSEALVVVDRLVLMTDMSFDRDFRATCPGPCLSSGKYKFTRGGRTNYIRFNKLSGARIDRYAYRMFGSSFLELRAVGTASWRRFKKADVAWCDEARDCGLQRSYSLMTCVGDWACRANKCSYDCGSTPPVGPPSDEPQNPCIKTGCSEELCADQPITVPSCVLRPEYACYLTATCERQSSGKCGWTRTAALRSCLGWN
ncbi:MAG: hypothetical protein HYY84_12200 [Deltaproteobacteria bacterium]|nr:hypothetical protein [Deltaproteobacteria bacterium]